MVELDDQEPIALAREVAWRLVHLLSIGDNEGKSQPVSVGSAFTATDLDIAQTIARKRAERNKLFGGGMFTDPAWDIMLDLFIADEKGQKLSVSSVCVAASVPATSALRLLKEMEGRKIVTREADECDRRRSFIMLTADARGKIVGLLRDPNASIL